VAIYLEKPKAIGSKPVIVVSIENHCVIRGKARFTRELFEILLADNVAANLILELRLPVKTNRPGDMAGFVGFVSTSISTNLMPGLPRMSLTQSVETSTSG
jgi:hypothetical protein